MMILIAKLMDKINNKRTEKTISKLRIGKVRKQL